MTHGVAMLEKARMEGKDGCDEGGGDPPRQIVFHNWLLIGILQETKALNRRFTLAGPTWWTHSAPNAGPLRRSSNRPVLLNV